MKNPKEEIVIVTASNESVLEGHEKRLHELISGAKPKNAAEKLLKKQIKEMKKGGFEIDIPFD